jgi:hypothetical protein
LALTPWAGIEYEAGMAALTLDSQIQDHIQSFVEELTLLIKRAAVQSVAEALNEGGGRRGPGRPRGAVSRSSGAPAGAGRRKGAKRDPQELEALTEKLNGYIKAHGGQRIEQIAQGMGTSTKELALPAKKLLATKKIRTTGTRRATKYFGK